MIRKEIKLFVNKYLKDTNLFNGVKYNFTGDISPYCQINDITNNTKILIQVESYRAYGPLWMLAIFIIPYPIILYNLWNDLNWEINTYKVQLNFIEKCYMRKYFFKTRKKYNHYMENKKYYDSYELMKQQLKHLTDQQYQKKANDLINDK